MICNPTFGMNQIFDHCFSLHFLDWGGGSVNESMFENGQHNIEKLLEFSHPIVTFFSKMFYSPVFKAQLILY